jgi:hypothetical protein
MDAREERTTKAILPGLSGPMPGVMAVLAALLLVSAGLGPVLTRSTAPTLPGRAPELAAAAALESDPGEGPVEGPALPPSEQTEVATGLPPRIESVSFGQGPVTASRDLRLEIHASDPDGDPVRLLTWWSINGRELGTVAPLLAKVHLRRGDTISARVVAFDGGQESTAFLTAVVVVENAPPLITTFPKGFDAAGAFVYPIGAIDPDGDHSLEYHLLEGPDGMAIEPHEGTLTWLPGSDQNGRHTVRLEVRDGRGGVRQQVFDLHVRHQHPASSDLADRAEP